MSKKRTDKSRYPSRYSPRGFVTAAQYITELICERKAAREKKELPIKFWDLKEWNKFYRYQIMLANKMLKEYKEVAIIRALRDDYRCKNTYSLRSPFLGGIIKEYEVMDVSADQSRKKIEADFSKKSTFRERKSSGIIHKLRELDDEQ